MTVYTLNNFSLGIKQENECDQASQVPGHQHVYQDISKAQCDRIFIFTQLHQYVLKVFHTHVSFRLSFMHQNLLSHY
jgi:hypothetical protein